MPVSTFFQNNQFFFLPFSRLASKLTNFINLLVMGCTLLLKLNHIAYSYLLLNLASVASLTTYYLLVGLSHTRASIFQKMYFLSTNLQIGITNCIHSVVLGCTWLLKLNHSTNSYLLLLPSFCSSIQYALTVGGFELCPCQDFLKIRNFFLTVSRLASEPTDFILFCPQINHGAYSYGSAS